MRLYYVIFIYFTRDIHFMKKISFLYVDQTQNLGMNNDEEWRPRRRGSQL